jgi:hypothetical protein
MGSLIIHAAIKSKKLPDPSNTYDKKILLFWEHVYKEEDE